MMHLAYLDAGSGSLIVQAVVGGTAGAAVAAKLYWRRVAARFRRQPTEAAEATTSGQTAGHTGSPATDPAVTGQPSGTGPAATGPAATGQPAPTERQPRQPAGN
ncbi:hypothetical protein TPA0907_27430 [Micromonospora humidisoli]|uniref:Uncharacterized protein n=1 Tax=Micromonospora humidisoli TaxID=2807622 RepID=A0ABS2JKA6_9ACTN|nr:MULTISPECIES: hypothetical protein [Micromonospora]MBM7086957.1 hypothetical protein [Micromonospora humidisoli]GHJ08376.1 hypothetical protein TPA0907_27430 [Micromonospora sp. AKA109]